MAARGYEINFVFVWRFPKIFQNLSEGQTNVSEHFPQISEDCQSRPKKKRRCFDHTATNLSPVNGTIKKCYEKLYLHM